MTNRFPLLTVTERACLRVSSCPAHEISREIAKVSL